MIGQRFWIRYDQVEGKTRFIWFLAFFVIPYSVLISINQLLGLLFAGIMILWRMLSVKSITKGQ